MIITKEKAREIAKDWGWKRLPTKGREYIRVHAKTSSIKFETLVHDIGGGFRLYWE